MGKEEGMWIATFGWRRCKSFSSTSKANYNLKIMLLFRFTPPPPHSDATVWLEILLKSVLNTNQSNPKF